MHSTQQRFTRRSMCRSAMVVGLLALSVTTSALPLDLSSIKNSPSTTPSTPYDHTSLHNNNGERIPFETIRRPITIQVDIRPTEEQETEEAPSPSLDLRVVDLTEEDGDNDESMPCDGESRNLLVDSYAEVLGDDEASGLRRLQEQPPSVEEMLLWPYVNLDQFESRSDEQQDEYEA